jgi:hypothetical protein
MATENQAWMYAPKTTTLTPTQLALRNRLDQQASGEGAMRVAGDMLQEAIRENARLGGAPWDPTGGLGSLARLKPSSGGGGGSLPSFNWSFGGSKKKEEKKAPTINVDYSGDGKNVDQLRAMYASALAELQRQQYEGGQTILGSADRMRNDPMNNANAYAALRASAPNVVGNPLAEYAEATGMSTDMANKGQALANADAQAYQNAVQNMYNMMSASQQAANDTRMADIGMIETGANQDLVTQANMLKLLLNQRETTDVVALQQRNLENAINQRNIVTQQIQTLFGQDKKMKPEALLELIEATLAKINTGQWGSGATT